MYKFNRLLIGLDLTDLDDGLIQYASMLAKAMGSEKAYFIHVAKDLELPEEIRKNYPDLLAPKDEALSALMKEKIDANWSAKSCEVVTEVKEGNPTDKILKWSGIKEVDLIIMGRKRELKGKGVLPNKLAKIAHASMILVPETSKPQINSILVPLDYSKFSFMALEQAQQLADETGATITLQNVYFVPSGYHSTGKSYEEFADIMKKNAEKNYSEFAKEHGFDEDKYTCVYSLDENAEPSDKIFEKAEEDKMDLIVMGSKGRTGIASILVGSIAEKLIQRDNSIPLLIVKDKKENMGFFEAILNI
jgi:nucleotide-binding universal stress UspA family protein